MTKKLILNDTHIQLEAKIVPFAGYDMPVQYNGVTSEHLCVRNQVGIFDVSHMGEFFVEGDKADRFLQRMVSNDISKLYSGKVLYAYLPNEKGGIIDDLLVYKINDKKFLLVVNAANIEKDFNWLKDNNDEKVTLTDASNNYCLFAVQGPKSRATLQTLTSVNLDKIPYYQFTSGTFAGAENVILSATGYTGAGGFEIYVENKYAKLVWDKIMQSGASYEIQPIGLAARDTLRLEMGYCLYGNDINDETSPVEAKLMWATSLEKEFIGKKAIVATKEKGAQHKLTAFIMEEKGIPRKDYEIVNSKDETIGKVTSGTLSPSLKQGIGLAYIKVKSIKEKEELYIKIRNKKLLIKKVKLPFISGNV